MGTNQIKHMLVPVNFEQESEQLLRYAGTLAKTFGAELVLLHATNTETLTFTQQSRCLQALRTLGERVLHSQQHCSSPDFVRFECVVRPGSLRESIKAVVQDYSIDLVLMEASPVPVEVGEQSNHAASVMEVLSCPVMAVPVTLYPAKPTNIVFATDFTDREERVLKQIASFAAQIGAKLTMVQVYHPEERSQRVRMKAAIRETQQLLANYDINYRLLEEEDMLEGISEFADKEGADMLLLATQDNYLMQRLFSNTYLKTMACHTQIPLVVFRQLKTKPCSGCCTNCRSKATAQPELQQTISLS